VVAAAVFKADGAISAQITAQHDKAIKYRLTFSLGIDGPPLIEHSPWHVLHRALTA
jgi:hypothetical protein